MVFGSFFPPLCPHCEAKLEANLLCPTCLSLLTFLDLTTCCRYCGAETEKGVCDCCRKKRASFKRVIPCFDTFGPAVSLVKKCKRGSPFLAKDLAALMVVQYLASNLPLPDFLVPIPLHLLRRLCRGYNQSALIAHEMGKLLSCPVVSILRKTGGDMPQTGLLFEQRQQLSSLSFSLKRRACIADKTLLLVDDLIVTGNTLRCAAEVLFEGCPKAVYAVVFCRG